MAESGPVVTPTVRRVVLVAGAVVGVVSLAWSLGLALFGISALVVTDDDAPLPVGSLALTRVVGVDDVAVGDVLNRSWSGVAIAQWITDVTDREVQAGRGDAATTAILGADDGASYQRAFVHVPMAGRVLQVAASPAGAFVAGGFATAVLLAGTAQAAALRPAPRKGRKPVPARGRGHIVVCVGLTWVGLAASVLGQGWGQAYL